VSGRSIFFELGPNEKFGVLTYDDHGFDVVPQRNLTDHGERYATRLEAVEAHLANLEGERRLLNRAIARAKRLRRAWRKDPTPPSRFTKDASDG
jgi:hypothetical protein